MYYLENRQRRLSLRFLTWFVLNENIQTDTHDSIEDALSALKLYKVHLQLEDEGTFDKKLEELYREGRQYVRLLVLSSLLTSQRRIAPLPRTSNHLPHRDSNKVQRQPRRRGLRAPCRRLRWAAEHSFNSRTSVDLGTTTTL